MYLPDRIYAMRGNLHPVVSALRIIFSMRHEYRKQVIGKRYCTIKFEHSPSLINTAVKGIQYLKMKDIDSQTIIVANL